MTHRHTFCLLSCLVYLGHYGFSHWHEKQMKSYSYEELTVPGEDLEECENQKNVCVLHNTDCMSVPSLRKGKRISCPRFGLGFTCLLRITVTFCHYMFSNISCHYLVHEKKFGCKWIHLKDVKSKLTHSFIFSQTTEISHCPSIFNVYGKFNLTIKSKDDINKIETYSEVYTVLIQNITYAPQPTITSVSAAETLLKVTWTTQWYTDKCQMRYKNSTMEQLIEVPVKSINKKGTEIVHVINGLQAFSQYNLTVACKGGYGLWSEWSAEVQAMTLEDGPTASPQVSYCVESLDKRLRTQEVLLVWKALEINEAQGVILGYEVMYTSAKQQSPIRIITTDLKARLVVAAGDYNISLMAFNSAGQSPVHHVGISSVFCESLPRVKGLWASSKEDSLRLRWEIDKIAASVSEFAIEWYSSGDAASKQWKRVNGTTFSAVLKESIKKLETYSISVYPLYDNLCGLPESIQANLESGTLVDIVQLQRVNMTKTSVTVQWVWEEKVSSTNILQYTIALVGGTETTSFLVFPHQHQHSFSKLQRNVKYSVYIYAETESGKFSKAHIEFTTPLIENDEIVKAALPVVILIFGFGIFSVLSRTIYKDYFFPNIANPSHSLIGHWLLNPLRGRDTVVSVLKLEDFSMTNQFTERCLIQIEHQKSLEKEDYDENMILTKTYLPDIDPVENSDDVENSQTFPVLSEYVDLPLIPDHCGYVENFQIPDD